MKTAISLPDAVYAQVVHQARVLGVSRSEFFARAAERYLSDLDRASLTRRIDEALAAAGEAPETADVVAAGRRHLSDIDDDW